MAVLAVGAVLLGVSGGAALALWKDSGLVSGADVSAGAVGFAVGRSGGTLTAATGPADTVPVTIGAAEATELVQEGVLALPLHVSALAQGNLGLRYDITMPTFTAGSYLAGAGLVLFPVTAADQCTAATQPPASQPALTATAVPATYTTTTTPSDQYWCLFGTLGAVTPIGTYTNTGQVTAQSSQGTVSATDGWTADVVADPVDEPNAVIEFGHETFRPGQ